MSLSLHWLPFIRYSLSPDLNILLVTATSLYSSGRIPVELSMTRVTSAIPFGFLVAVPAKITSCILLPRSCLELCSPSTHLRASLMLLLPLPLGPMIHVIPSFSSIFTGSANDLNPCISIRLKYTYFAPFESASFAASCSALALLLPCPLPITFSPATTSTVKVLL